MTSARILIADDEPAVRAVLRATLEKAGYEVAETADGREVLRAAVEDPPDLVILDLAMPGMDGIEVLRELRSRHLALPVLAFSGAPARDITLHTARLLGAADILGKPVEPAQLLAAVAETLERRAAGGS